MDDLKDLLDLTQIRSDEKLQERFKTIAELLMCEYEINKGKERYAIVEIEFYLYTNYHRDYITYPRDLEAGRWFFHQSGVDLTFKSVLNNKVTNKLLDNPCFGGILIRGIYNLDSRESDSHKYTFGPQKCVDVLWQNLDAFGPTSEDYPVLQKAKHELPHNICQCKRYININDDLAKKANQWAKRLGLTPVTNQDDIDKILEYLEKPYRFFNMQNGDNPCSCTKTSTASRPKKEELIPLA